MLYDIKDCKLKFFNTETRKKEILSIPENQTIRIYTCGPTVYDYAHIGNFRTYIFEDILRKTLQFFGIKVCQVMNITDVDDKTISGASQKKVSLKEYTDIYKEAFFKDIKTLKIEQAEYYPAATDHIPEMINMIQDLIDKGFAYIGSDGSVYYSIKKFPNYGRLSHLKSKDLKAGIRISNDNYDKENIGDFVIWKAYNPQRDGKIYWHSPFGKGRPGWHIECSAIALKFLGNMIDIHMGGVDNIFPHHENEIAQSEAHTNTKFVKLWLHAEHLIVNNKKMSKSLKNFYTLHDLINKGYIGDDIRYTLLQTHYKTQLNFALESLDAAKASRQRLNDFIFRLQNLSTSNNEEYADKINEGHANKILEKCYKEFAKSLANDLNISLALASIFDMIRKINSLMDKKIITKKETESALSVMKSFDKVLNIMDFKTGNNNTPQKLLDALEQRQNARKNKNWQLADDLRKFIYEEGYIIEDSKDGARLKAKTS